MTWDTENILSVIALIMTVVAIVPWPNFNYHVHLVGLAVILLAIANLVS